MACLGGECFELLRTIGQRGGHLERAAGRFLGLRVATLDDQAPGQERKGGALATGIFASSTVQAAYSGLLDGNPQQLVTQAVAVAATVLFAAIGTVVIVKVVDLILGIRVKPEAEEMGLDLAVHGEAAYQS